MKESISSRLQKASSKLTSVAWTNFLRDATSSIGVFGIGLAEEAAPMFFIFAILLCSASETGRMLRAVGTSACLTTKH